jgi:hypothetical protein
MSVPSSNPILDFQNLGCLPLGTHRPRRDFGEVPLVTEKTESRAGVCQQGAGIWQSSSVTHEQAPALHLSWQPEVVDYLQAFNVRNRARRAWHKVAVIALLGAVFAVVAFVLRHPDLALLGVELAVLLPLMIPLVTWLSTLSVWRRRPALHTPTRAMISPSAGITTDGPLVDMSSGQVAVTAISGLLRWHAVEQVLETKRVFVVQLAGHRGKRFLLLAKRGLDNPTELDALRRTLTGAHPTIE